MNFTSLRDHLEKVHVFSVIARVGSFRKAAKALRLTQPSLSRSVKILEDTLGQPLFSRTRHGVHLTKAGQTLFEFSGKISSELQKLEYQIRSTNSNLSAKLMIGSYESLAIRMWPRFIQTISKNYPGISISLKTTCENSLLLNMLLSSQLDLIVTISPREYPELINQKLFSDSFGIYCSPKLHLESFSTSKAVSLESLKTVPFILVPSAIYEDGATVEQLAWKLGLLGRQLIYELDSFEAAKEFISEGIGLGLLPQWVAKPALDQERLVELKVQDILSPIGLHTIFTTYRKSDKSDPAIQTLVRETASFF